ncbi:MAG TPA: retroviral-like aspartic protease family protein [Dyella sp.]|uniref:retroviral-like aspartic protease family protein n=1 Tax=Dyella sp. TaxID=1869338 RepID=UPI002F95A23E
MRTFDLRLHGLANYRWAMATGAAALITVLTGCSAPPSPASADASASPAIAVPASPTSAATAAVKCMRDNDLACAEANWKQYVKLRPTDVRGIASLGVVLNKEDKNDQAIAEFEKDIRLGAGAYDLFAYYADSLDKVGRTDEAIDWSYKTLKLEPSLVDVREKLGQMLVLKKRSYEALTLLSEFDEYLDEHGQPQQFLGNRMAIESAMHDLGKADSHEAAGLRLVKFKDTFYAPVSVGQSGVRAFVVDTGATSVVVNDAFLASSKVPYKTLRSQVEARLADGRVVAASQVLIDRLMVGPMELDNVKALSCQSCELLLGSNALSAFTMNVSQVKGVDVATLTPHNPSHS